MRTKKIKGTHYIFDLYGCDYHEITDAENLESVLLEAAATAKMEVLHSHFHSFSPHGVTGLILLSTSHISVHTWPEYGYAAFDVFSCSSEAQTRLAVNHILEKISCSRKKITKVGRGYAELKTISIPVYKDGTNREISVHKKIVEIKSAFQKIMVLDLEKFGRTMLIDGITQLSTSDVDVYNKAITAKLRSSDKNILILGGGDGYVAREILSKNPEAAVTMVELDQEVVFCASEYFGMREFFKDQRLNLVISDAQQFLKVAVENGHKYEGIIFDLTDEPIGGGKALAAQRKFFGSLLEESIRVLSPNGWIASQAGVPLVKPPRVSVYSMLKELFESNLKTVTELKVNIPSFCDDNVFLFGEKK